MSGGASDPRRRAPRRRAAIVAIVVVVGVSALAVSGFEGTLTYYRTPSEVVKAPPPSEERLRLGGMVVPGSIHRDGEQVRFVLTDGAADVDVVSSIPPPRTFRQGEGAVVEGVLAGEGLFHADRVVVRHSNEYRPADAAD